jgi:hypothetical protein
MSARGEAVVRAHLNGCAQCQEEYDYLAVVPQWLDLVKKSAATPANWREQGSPGHTHGDDNADNADPGTIVELARDM